MRPGEPPLDVASIRRHRHGDLISSRPRGHAKDKCNRKRVRCTTSDGGEVRVYADHIAIVRHYKKDRGGTGSEIIFAGGVPSALVVQEDQIHLTGRLP